MLTEFIVDNRFELERLFDRYADRTAYVGPGLSLTYRALRQRIILAAAHIRDCCHPMGSRICVYIENPALYPILMQAAWQTGALFVPFDIRAPLKALLSIVEPDLLITDQPVPSGFTARVIHPDRLFEETRVSKNPAGYLNALNLDAEASIILTSGSSGTPKGVVHTIGNYLYSAWGTIEYLSLSVNHSWLASLPLFHVSGLLIFIRTMLSGAVAILPEDGRALEASIKTCQPDFLSLVPTQLIRFLEQTEITAFLKNCRGILLGGAAAPGWLIRKAVRQGVPVLPTYGSTESCAQVTGVDPDAPAGDRLTSGKVLRFRTVRLDTDRTIIIGGKTIFKTYLSGDRTSPIHQDHEFRTSDIGRFDAAGNLVVLGRSDQMFLSGGEIINPFEIEQVLAEQEGVTTAVVVPVNHPEFGQVPWAFVQSQHPLDPVKIKQLLRKGLPPYKIPKEILKMPVDDRMNAMKPDRRKLAQIASKISENGR